ncbi:PD-(D/E)XK nuclease-like domain-containing protein [Clostridium massiliodielmoense]|uniref:PD-(D/E)XK nuclease-like domain-containing protein n=1 Tax=Clostridium massiliodielmoense TaxID=1776385 RepID=UPI000A26FC88|nr:PD-(D/E)XK nuclease-like domain-containing protein [Clostridium massiliodielmoense]
MQLNKENYFSLDTDKEYFSVSQFKAFRQCEAKAMAKLNGEWKEKENEAFLLGSYVHAWSEGTLVEFKQNNPQLFKKDGTLYAKYQLGDKMISTLANDLLVERVREGQKEVIMTAELFGAKWKCMMDIYNPDKKVFADLKTTRELHKKYWNDELRIKQNFIEYYDYLLQMAVYAEIERINRAGEEYFQPHIIAVDKQDPPDKAVIFTGTDFIKDKLLEVETLLPRFIKVKNGKEKPIGCGHCDYCRSIKQLNTILRLEDI